MELEPTGKMIHYFGAFLFIGGGIYTLYVVLAGLVHGDFYIWTGIFYLVWGFILLLVLHFRPQWLGIKII